MATDQATPQATSPPQPSKEAVMQALLFANAGTARPGAHQQDYQGAIAEMTATLDKLRSWDLSREDAWGIATEAARKISSINVAAGVGESEINSVVPTEVARSLVTEMAGQAATKRYWRPFIEQLVPLYIQNLQTQGVKIPEGRSREEVELITNEVSSSLADVPLENTDEAVRQLKARLHDAGARLGANEDALRKVESLISKPATTVVVAAARIRAEATRSVFTVGPDIIRKDIQCELATELAVQNENYAVPEVEPEKLARAAQAFSAVIPAGPPAERPPISGNFFKAAARTPVQKLIAPILDIVGGDVAARAVLTRAWVRTNKNLESIVGATASSEVVRRAVQWGAQAFRETQPAAGGVFGGIRRVVGDVAGTIFQEPISEELASYFRLVEMGRLEGRVTLTWWHFAYAASSPDQRHFHLAFLSDMAGWLFRGGAAGVGKRALGEAVKTAGTAAVKKGASLLTQAVLAVATGGGSLLGKIALWLGSSLVGKIFGGAKNWLTSLFAPGATPQGKGVDWVTIGIIVVIALVAAPALLGLGVLAPFSPGGAAQLAETARMTALVAPPVGGEEEDPAVSRYIKVTKVASPSSFPDNNPTQVVYTVTIEARDVPLTIVSVTDDFRVYAKSGNPAISPPTLPPPDSNRVEPGSPYTFSFSVSLGPAFRDSVIVNTITVVVQAAGTTDTALVSASVVVGNPPSGCLVPGSAGVPDAYGGVSTAWSSGDWGAVMGAAAALFTRAPAIHGLICESPITAYRVNGGGGGSVRGDIVFFYNGGVSSGAVLYTLSHELGHILDHRRPEIYAGFKGRAISKNEGNLWTYPFDDIFRGGRTYSERWLSEDFAETMGAYPVYKFYNFNAGGGTRAKLNYSQEYPQHYDFARNIIFGGVDF